jgi:hypothetical protein
MAPETLFEVTGCNESGVLLKGRDLDKAWGAVKAPMVFWTDPEWSKVFEKVRRPKEKK